MKFKYILVFIIFSFFGLGCCEYIPQDEIEVPPPSFVCEELPNWASFWGINPLYAVQNFVLSDKSTFIFRIFIDAQNSSELLCLYSDSTYYPHVYLEYYPFFSSLNGFNGAKIDSFYLPPYPQLSVVSMSDAKSFLATNLTSVYKFEQGQSNLVHLFTTSNNVYLQDAQFINNDSILVFTMNQVSFTPMWYLINSHGDLLDSMPNLPGSSRLIGLRPVTKDLTLYGDRGLVLYDLKNSADTGRVVFDRSVIRTPNSFAWIDEHNIVVSSVEEGLVLYNLKTNTFKTIVAACRENMTGSPVYSKALDLIYFSNLNIDTIQGINGPDTVLVRSSICHINPDGSNFSCFQIH